MSGTISKTTAKHNVHSEKWFLTPFLLVIALPVLCLLAGTPLHAADAVADPPADRTAPGLLAVALPNLDSLDDATRSRLVEARARVNAALQDRAAPRALADVYGELAALYQVYSLHVAAAQCYENAITLDPGNFRWTYLSAYHAATNGHMQLAIQRYRQARTLKPGYKAASVRLADAYLELSELDMARTAYQEVIDEAGLEAASHFGLGQIALLQRDYETAITHFKRALELDPAATRIHYSLGLALRAVKRNAEAVTQLALRGDVLPSVRDPQVEGLKAMKSGARVHFIDAIKAINRQDYDTARDHFSKGLAMEPENAIALVSYARTLYLTGEATEARATLEQATRLQPDNTLGLFLLGVLVEEGGDASASQDFYQRVLVHEPEHAGANYYLGNHYFRINKPRRAASHYQQALASDARYSAAYIPYLGTLIASAASDHEIRNVIEDAARHFPEQPVFRGLQVRLLATSDDPGIANHPEALRLAEQLIEEQRIPPHLELLALACAVNNQFDRAVSLLEELVIIAAWSMPAEAGRLSETLEAYQAGQLPSGDQSRWPVILPPPFDAQGPFRNYPAARPY